MSDIKQRLRNAIEADAAKAAAYRVTLDSVLTAATPLDICHALEEIERLEYAIDEEALTRGES